MADEIGVEELPASVSTEEGCNDPLGASEQEGVDGGVYLSGEHLNVPTDKWNEASQLLFQPGYIQVLKQMAMSGQMQMYNIRSVAWRLFLGCLPEEQSKWAESTKKSRERYNSLKKKYITDPHIASASLDVAINNPLSQADNSPWHQFFQDTEMRQMIDQDVVRTFPDVSFFKQAHIQETMLDLLFIYCKEKPDLGYRQGMHEMLAPVLFVLHAEEREHDDPCLAPEVQIVMDSDYLEHDAYTIFFELMEGMEQWYMSSALEADYYRTRSQVHSNRRMHHDPRTQKPFEECDLLGNSAISRKLEMIHQVLLKRADEVLFTQMKDLSIPAQTYGIRWIRLLFGREFPLPSVLELWDAIFSDGPSLGLMDYICVAMLMHIRQVLMEGDYAVCMKHLMHFPAVCEVNYLVQRALHLRSPTSFPSPRIWTYHPNSTRNMQRSSSHAVSQLMDESYSTGTGATKGKLQNSSEKIADFFQSKVPWPKSTASTSNRSSARLEFQKSSSRSPSPTRKQDHHHDNGDAFLTDEQLFSGGSVSSVGSGTSSKKTARFKIIGKTKKAESLDREMTHNPKAHTLREPFSDVDQLTARLEDMEAKCLYCGGKMDSMITVLQDEIPEIPNLSPEQENTLLLSIAGLKQIRDLLLKKIPFSGDSTLGWDFTHDTRKEKSGEYNVSKEDSTIASNNVNSEAKVETSASLASVTPLEENSEETSEKATSELSDDWVDLSNSSGHPLVATT